MVLLFPPIALIVSLSTFCYLPDAVVSPTFRQAAQTMTRDEQHWVRDVALLNDRGKSLGLTADQVTLLADKPKENWPEPLRPIWDQLIADLAQLKRDNDRILAILQEDHQTLVAISQRLSNIEEMLARMNARLDRMEESQARLEQRQLQILTILQARLDGKQAPVTDTVPVMPEDVPASRQILEKAQSPGNSRRTRATPQDDAIPILDGGAAFDPGITAVTNINANSDGTVSYQDGVVNYQGRTRPKKGFWQQVGSLLGGFLLAKIGLRL